MVKALALAAGLLASGTAYAAEEAPLTIHGIDGTEHSFIVEVVRTPEDMARGLMYRTGLAADRGMLFDYGEPRMASFWMKNTLIPLDMFFIEADGRIARIHENAEPLSLESIPSGVPVRAVLELKGGTAERLGIEVGDRVRSDALR